MKHTDEEIIAIVADYLQSGLSQVKYHESHELKCNIRTFERWCSKFKSEALSNAGLAIKGTSQLIDADGNVKLTWVKTNKKIDDARKAIKAFAEGLKDDLPKALPDQKKPDVVDDLLTTYILTDLHIGMRSDEWNKDIASQNIINYIDEAVTLAPASHTGVLVFMGDTAHFDSMKPVTPASGHVLDADMSAREMTRLIAKMVRYCTSRLLERHQHVHIVYCSGNHDEFSAIIHSEYLALYYEDEPRVSVDIANNLYHVVEWGSASLFFHHGHKRNINDVSKTFTAMFREVFGRTKYSYGHIGHYHHAKRRAMGDDGLMEIRIHPTLAGKDDYALFGGWISQNGANVITYSKTKGHRGEFKAGGI